MARSKKNETPVGSYQFGHAKRLNIPEATETQTNIAKGKAQTYRYNPHLPPKLRFDESGTWDQAKAVIEKSIAGKKLTADEAEVLRAIGEQGAQPWLEWAGKQEQQKGGEFEVDDVVLHIHERISAQAIVAAARRHDDTQQDFFVRPKLAREQAVQYYRYSMDWANRLILGDSLQVMSSLARREGLAGGVQMVYMDPPYGINFSSNWQSEIADTNVSDSPSAVTREIEAIKAYRDTWKLGVHSYLQYLRQRLVVAHELLQPTGSVFIQISAENLHRVTTIADEIFGSKNQIALIYFRKKTMPLGGTFLESMGDYIVWYAKDKENAATKFRRIYRKQDVSDDFHWNNVICPNGTVASRDNLTSEILSSSDPFRLVSMWPPSFAESAVFPVKAFGREWVPPPGQCWPTNVEGMQRLYRAGRLIVEGKNLRYQMRLSDYDLAKLNHAWTDTTGARDPRYVVQTAERVIERCMLMTTEPGDLVIDPTCGSGTTAAVAEQWGRRWITIDSSRVAVSIARQRLLTSVYETHKTKDPSAGYDNTIPQNPAFGFHYETAPRISMKVIAQNPGLDPILERNNQMLTGVLAELNEVLHKTATASLRELLVEKLRTKVATDGGRAVTDSELGKWLLPGTEGASINFGTATQAAKWRSAIPQKLGWAEWNVPQAVDDNWPTELKAAWEKFTVARKQKDSDVKELLKKLAPQEELVDRPVVVKGVTRVSGPFSVEGVRPEELALGEDGKIFDPTANTFNDVGSSNADGYIDLMVGLLRKDGVTFLGNRRAEFAELNKEAGKEFHARGRWKTKADDLANVAVFFGPQYGPVNAPMMREAIEGAQGLKEIDELVVAGFSFDAAAQEVAKDKDSEKLRIHLAHIRPDVSPGMQGLLKETANSQLFTVFGQPEISVSDAADGMKQVEMSGVCVYNPLTGEITEAAGNKVAAWFLDADYDGRCFCVSQAFFPDKDAWGKIAKALGSSVSEDAFEDSTVSWPFKVGKNKRIAVKVIDPRGNEVMAIKTLNA